MNMTVSGPVFQAPSRVAVHASGLSYFKKDLFEVDASVRVVISGQAYIVRRFLSAHSNWMYSVIATH